jgi:hypothetical protein
MAHLHKNIIKFHHQFFLFVHPLGEMGFLFCGQKMIPQKTAETLTSDEVPLWGKKIRGVYDVNER